jgi:hypothetical protein
LSTKNCWRLPSLPKRNHLHLINFETLNSDELEELGKKLSLKDCKKNKLSNMKELLGKFFQNLKVQISKSLDSVCESMIDRISNACLSNLGLLDVYKKVVEKDYKKISTP